MPRTAFVLFVVGLVAFALLLGGLWLLSLSLLGKAPVAWHWVPVCSSLLAVILAMNSLLSGRRIEGSQGPAMATIRIHLDLGEYSQVAHGSQWMAEVASPVGGKIRLSASGPGPTDEQIQRWKKLEPALPRMVEECVKLLWPPPEPCAHPARPSLVLESVTLVDAGGYALEFACHDVTEQIHMWPAAVLSSNLGLISATWDP